MLISLENVVVQSSLGITGDALINGIKTVVILKSMFDNLVFRESENHGSLF